MSPARWPTWTATLAVAAVLAPTGCGSRTAVRPAAEADSSFAAVAFQRGRPPLELSEDHGRLVYERYCAICHGSTGEGDGFNAYNVTSAFGVAPTAFGDSAAFHALNADTAMAVIRDGGATLGRSSAMPPWGGTLTPGEVADVWHYIGRLAREAPSD